MYSDVDIGICMSVGMDGLNLLCLSRSTSTLSFSLSLSHLASYRIFSNSWGSAGANAYDTRCEQVDNFMHVYPDALVVFAAGNAGNNLTTRYGIWYMVYADGLLGVVFGVVCCEWGMVKQTLHFCMYRNKAASPSVAKNCLTVGASSNAFESWQAILQNVRRLLLGCYIINIMP